MGTIKEALASPLQRRSRFQASFALCLLLPLAVYIHFGFLSSHLFSSESQLKLNAHYADKLERGLQKCESFKRKPVVYSDSATGRKANPRWNSVTGQNQTVVLHNVTLFNGDHWVEESVDITFEKGIITKISLTSMNADFASARVVSVGGGYVTPGLVDMHSHHLVGPWPALEANDDVNEVNKKAFGPLTPFVRSMDGIKPWDQATDIIRSGGVTSSLILPGSANIMGGEAYVVKNVLRAGIDSEESVEEMLLEYGVDDADRRRYMKMACGENPSRVYDHTRMGNSWIFRQHMERARELKESQDSWCLAASAARESGDASRIAALATEDLPEQLELETSVAMLRGQIGLHNHCYEPEDFEAMLRNSAEFGFHIHAFHHALSAWKVPELIKKSGQNITIATFSDFGFYKLEGYEANLYAGRILEEHGVPVAYKSDHGEEATNAKYLLFEAQNAHRFGMSESGALRAVTSAPAKALRLDHRVGYAKVGFDADLVIWDSHPLNVGATPLQVYVDGRETLDEKLAVETTRRKPTIGLEDQQRVRPMKNDPVTRESCAHVEESGSVIISGIRTSLLSGSHESLLNMKDETEEHHLILQNGKIRCFDTASRCSKIVSSNEDLAHIRLSNGHLAPGLTAVTTGLGLEEIAAEDSTADGWKASEDHTTPESLVYAKYGVRLSGRAFERARIGGVTRAVTIPHVDFGGFGGAVSAGIKTSGKETILDGGIFQDEVGVHFVVGQGAKKTTGTVSGSILKLKLLLEKVGNDDNIFGKVVSGKLPLVVHVENKDDILQLLKIKRDLTASNIDLNMVLFGAAESPLVAPQLAAANVSVIFSHHRGSPDSWEEKDILTGPPLTLSPVQILHEANVTFALAIESAEGNSFIHNLATEAAWAGKFAGLSDREAVGLVSGDVETILGLERSRDVVIWEGNPLKGSGAPAIVFDGENRRVLGCWPYSR